MVTANHRITAAVDVAQTWPQVRKIAHIHPRLRAQCLRAFHPRARTAVARPSGYLYMRPDHQAYKDAVTGFSKNLPQYEFAS